MTIIEKLKGKVEDYQAKRAEQKQFDEEKKMFAKQEYDETYRQEAMNVAKLEAREKAVKKAHTPPITKRLTGAAIHATKKAGEGTVDIIKGMGKFAEKKESSQKPREIIIQHRKAPAMQPATSKFSPPTTEKFLDMQMPTASEGGLSPMMSGVFAGGGSESSPAIQGALFGSEKREKRSQIENIMSQGERKTRGGGGFSNMNLQGDKKSKGGGLGGGFSSMNFYDGTSKKGKEKNYFGGMSFGGSKKGREKSFFTGLSLGETKSKRKGKAKKGSFFSF